MIDFDPVAAEQQKLEGMEAAASARRDLLELARCCAVNLASEQGTVTADDVQRRMIFHGYKPSDLGNAAGSIFIRDFVPTGEFRASTRVGRRCGMMRVWKLKGK